MGGRRRPHRGGLQHPTKCAFTLIEVLAAMTVLVLLVLALTRMFGEAVNITKRGTTALMRNSVGETAMDSILQDLDCMIVNERIACAKIAGKVLGGGEDDFDTFYCITTSGDQDDDMPYHYVKLYVRATTVTTAEGAEYRRFDLYKGRMVMAVGASASGTPFYALNPDDQEWWDAYETHTDDAELLAENVVMFDIYCQRWDTGKDFVTSGDDFYSSDSLAGVSNIPPVAVDVMLVLTSPEAAVEGGMLIATGDPEMERRGWEILHRDASVLIGRAMPMMGAPQYRMQRRASYNPVSHYYPE
ncbi:MAG: prepilin-type N-terminal cleavage/methylation domain-containing protein [Kiritimatiellae bacterium]|jgi:prepilin-type N-terminal cleavage/methylation domain-containing protein|nr:prepilin-type N-terminal cleavage/methylation domain-containing protein [Kiritimatiellia bacterium]